MRPRSLRLDIAAADGVAVLAGPLRDDAEAIIDACGLADELRRAIAQAQLALAPKVSVVVDGGGRLHLDALTADIRLRAVGPANAPRLLVGFGVGVGAALLPPRCGGGSGRGSRAACAVLVESQRTPTANPPPEGGEGVAAWLGAVAPERAVDVVLSLLREIAAHGPAARAADVIRAAASTRFARCSTSNRSHAPRRGHRRR